MIFKSFILGNLVSLCMKIINSVIVVGLYYGFLTTFSIGPSYLFLLRARVMEEGTEKKVSATTGFITGQLMMFISIYYVPLHLALGRPHTITVLALPYLLFHFFWNNHKHFFDYGSTNRNSMRNLSIQCVFLNNLIFQLFNHFILPSSMLVRLVNIYMFRCNNKMLFVTSSFVGWLIGHILFMKWVGLVLVWIQQNHSIRSNVLIRSNKYLVSELRNSMARIFSILLFITCVYYLGRIPSPIITKKLKETSKTEERGESEEETDVEIETTSETKETKQEQEGSTEEDPSPSLFSEEKEDPNKIDETKEIRVNGKEKTKDEFHFKDTRYQKKPVYETYYLNVDGNQENSKSEIFKAKKDILWFEKPLVTILFDYKRWNRPLRYIKNNRFENAVRNEMSQYFFYTCQSDGKEKISFTYPPSLSTFFEMLEKKMSIFTTEKTSSKELENNWSYSNEQKRKNVTKKFINRIKNLDKALEQTINGRSFFPGILEKKTRFCNDNIKNKYLQKIYDPLLKGPYRGRIKKAFSSSITNGIYMENYIERFWINKIHGILLIINYLEIEQKKSQFDKKSLETEITYFFNLINEFTDKSSFLFKEHSLLPEQVRIDSENQKKYFKFIFDRVITDPKKYIGITEISKKVPRWSYKLKNDLEQKERENEENAVKNHEIRLRKFKRVVIFTDNLEKNDAYTTTKDTNNTDQKKELALIRYSQQSDFRRDIIKGSMRAQRRKTIIWNLFEANVHSPLFLDRIDKDVLFSFDTSEPMKIFFKKGIGKKKEFKKIDYTERKIEESEKKQDENKIENGKKREKTRIEIAEAWDSFLFAQVLRGLLLVTHSIFRKYVVLPSLIIVKNIVRMLFFQFPEWSEDFKDWNREMHVKCTYNGVLLSEKEFPNNWLTDGIQIKILYPFHLKPWHKLKSEETYKDTTKNKKQKNDFCFLTVWGKETELPFGSPRKKFSFFEPIFKELKKKIIKWKRKGFLVLSFLKEITKFFLNISKEIKKWVIKEILFLKEIRKEFIKLNPIFGLKKIYEFNESKKDSIIINEPIHELSIQIQSMDWTNFSLKKNKIKNLTNRTSTVINQIQKITKDNKKRVLTSDISSNKMGCYDKKLELPKNIFKILKRKNARVIRKFYFFIKMFIEKIYIDIFLGIINIPRIDAQFFYESTNQILNKYSFNKYIYDNEKNKKRMEKRNQSIIHFISTIKKSLCNINNNRSQTLFDLSYLSQAYVFYKLSQPPVFNSYLYKLRSAFEYNGSSHFIKNEIKNYFVVPNEIFHSELRHKNIHNSGTDQWKNWLNSHYQYDLSTIRWSRLISKKWINRVNQHSIEKSKYLNKYDSYEKNHFINQEQKNNFKADSLWNQKENYKKQYKYDRLSYQFISDESINYEDKKNSSIYGLSFQANKNQEIFYNYSEQKQKLDNMLGGIPINNYLFEDDILDIEKNKDRKYFDWITLRFCLTKKVDIETWINIDPDMNSQKYTKTNKSKSWINSSQIIEKINNKSLFYLTIHQNPKINLPNKKKKLLDWMGMNNEILSCPISNLELWFFPEFVRLYNVYKIKPWAIPIKLLLLNLKIYENASENKSITGNKKKSIELENINQGEKESETESIGQADFDSSLPNPEKEVAENYAESKIKKDKNKKQYRNNTEAELNFFLKKYLRFQLKWGGIFNQKIMNNVKVYCLLLRLINPQEITISSIQRGEMSLDILMIHKKLTFTELMKEGILIIEPVRLSIKNEGQFFVYQTIGISLVHKSKHEIIQKYLEKGHVDKKTSSKFIAKHQKMAGNRDTNLYDLFVPENLLAHRRRRKLRILIYFNSKNQNCMSRNAAFCNGKKINSQAWDKSKKDKKKLIKLKLFLWPNFRLEDLACMNRYWFDTNNGSRFSMIRIHMYPRLIIP
uniref:hypothetical chloroplast RF1 n=1 Tax=Hippophae rhamnoides subsp. caucasica TaxID=1185385 RepID=UPI0020595B41|nr:hypothetical chloroplast RF1 [Hippophae rhamnoides subsp. caucasica]UNZ11521.1 hypothetical chloroplast RF19 [Hippophae rhamnoides subsp. caucasica]WMZ98429.1 hypothetical chloroplast RF1 [Hippophae rhamnoides subsp. caucasica]